MLTFRPFPQTLELQPLGSLQTRADNLSHALDTAQRKRSSKWLLEPRKFDICYEKHAWMIWSTFFFNSHMIYFTIAILIPSHSINYGSSSYHFQDTTGSHFLLSAG